MHTEDFSKFTLHLLSLSCHRLLTAVARFRTRVKSCEIYGGQSRNGAGFLRVRPLPFPLFHYTNCSIITIHRPWLVQKSINDRSNIDLVPLQPHRYIKNIMIIRLLNLGRTSRSMRNTRRSNECIKGHDAQVVRGRLPTAAVRVRAQVRICQICGVQNGTGGSYFRICLFPLTSISPNAAHP